MARANAQNAMRWVKATAQVARWAEAGTDKDPKNMATTLDDAARDAVICVNKAMANVTEAEKQAPLLLEAAQKADQQAQTVMKAVEGEFQAATKLREEAEERLNSARQERDAIVAEKKVAEDKKQQEDELAKECDLHTTEESGDLLSKQGHVQRTEEERAKAAASVGLAETEDNGTGDATVSSEAPSPPAAPTGPVAESTNNGDVEVQKYATSTDSVAPIPASADPPQLPATPKSPAGRGIGTGDGSSDVRMRLPPLLMLLGALTYLAL
ncbi:hypothetical protein DQ04_02951010 [Trypanosoma grayi]|uniref:hypothetical protein n=1 Tax=Trypanosoma grayi TaxID=71804 RepID=UPI0004F48B2B|nr:hypothetical protein DQ04_02951010 [Trypanosoma grayi]KEG11123.1 hypothetical protein DQ04_02951010 [Trypanosoma grayi]